MVQFFVVLRFSVGVKDFWLGMHTDDFPDWNDLVRDCKFSTTSFNPSATQSVVQSTGSAAVTTSAGRVTVTENPTQTSQNPAGQTSNAAQVMNVHGVGAVVVLGAAVALGGV
jgi:hypothetical protein